MSQRVRKIILAIVILLSYFPIGYALYTNISWAYNVSVSAAFLGFITLFWAYVMGIKRFMGKFIEDIKWVYWLHKWMNILGYLLFLAHPMVIIFAIYGPEILMSEFNEFGIRVRLGSTALFIWTLAWVTSAFFRKRLKFRPWKRIHLLNYLILPLVFFHMQVGFIHASNPYILAYFQGLFGVFVLLATWQLLGRLGFLRSKYKVIEVINQAENTVTVRIQHHSGSKIHTDAAQYIYVQLKPAGEAHPFSVSGYDNDAGILEFTVKALGKFSNLVQNVNVGDQIIVDGPYGKFTRGLEQSALPSVLVAGGIGITPFISKLDDLTKVNHASPIYLFYGARTESDIAFGEKLSNLKAKLPSLEIIFVISNQEGYQGETGFITVELIKKYLGDQFDEANYYLCGPPIMVEKLKPSLDAATATPDNIFTEEFST